MSANDPLFLIIAFVVALAYSSVGHGGASGYLALMAFSTLSTKEASALALVMNIAVSSIAFMLFRRARHFSWKLAWPFLVSSIPCAFIGGQLHLSGTLHTWLLALALLYAAIALLVRPGDQSPPTRDGNMWIQIGIGAAIGLMSGVVGIGGGIFLGPIIIMVGWGNAKQAAAVSALFILLNSGAGLMARGAGVSIIVSDHINVLGVAICGAIWGSWLGANRVPDLGIRRLLAAVLLVAITKFLLR